MNPRRNWSASQRQARWLSANGNSRVQPMAKPARSLSAYIRGEGDAPPAGEMSIWVALPACLLLAGVVWLASVMFF